MGLHKRMDTLMDRYLMGQRVILNNTEIGTIVPPETSYSKGVWVRSPSKGYASCYAPENVKPLPNGQL